MAGMDGGSIAQLSCVGRARRTKTNSTRLQRRRRYPRYRCSWMQIHPPTRALHNHSHLLILTPSYYHTPLSPRNTKPNFTLQSFLAPIILLLFLALLIPFPRGNGCRDGLSRGYSLWRSYTSSSPPASPSWLPPPSAHTSPQTSPHAFPPAHIPITLPSSQIPHQGRHRLVRSCNRFY